MRTDMDIAIIYCLEQELLGWLRGYWPLKHARCSRSSSFDVSGQIGVKLLVPSGRIKKRTAPRGAIRG